MTAVATAQYGALQGMVMPILLLPTALTYSLAVSLVPSLSEAAGRRDLGTVNKRIHQSLRLALIAGGPFAATIYVLAGPICQFVYNDPQAGTMLRAMAPAALFIYAQGPLQAALQALDMPGIALRNTFIGACAKLALIALLASNPAYGIMGAIAAINVNIVLVTALHWLAIGRTMKFPLSAAEMLKYAAALAFTAFAAKIAWDHPLFGNEALRLAAALAAGFAAYFASCAGLGLIDRHDAARVLMLGKKIVK
jgi:stage V sporulation protein B